MAIRGMRSGALAGALALVIAVGVLSPATAAQRDDYPSWAEVEAARGNQAETEATIARIDTLLAGLEADAARLGDAAVARGAEADAARAALARATQEADSLSARADAAAALAAQSAARAAQVAAALYRSGGTDLTGTLLLTSGDTADDLLERLGSLDRLGQRLELAVQRADADRNQSAALSAQAAVARAARATASAAAQSTAAAAAAASQAADAAVATQQAGLTQLYDQLATLKNTTAALEQQYRAGQQASNDPGGNSGGGDDGGEVVVPGGEVNDVAAARSYAFGQLAAAGLGSGQADCLLWLWNRESGWRTNAYNASSGAYGIPQSLPGSKMAVMGADWRTNYKTQVNWGLAYIYSRYDTPCGAWAHSEDVGWY